MAKRKDTPNEENNEQKKPRKRARRIKGTGSVYPRSDGRWGADFIEEATGKKRTLYGRTAKEAQDKLDKALLEQKQGILATGPKQKLADHLEWWLEEVHKHKLRISTYSRYRTLLDKYIRPELGHIQLGKLTTMQLQSFYNKKLEANLSPSFVHQAQELLHNALKSAVKSRYIAFNPADGIELPPNEPRRPGQSLTLEQVKLLFEKARGRRLEAFIAVALTTGMRHGEMLALRWDDINFEQGTVYIHRTVFYVKGVYVEGGPKTKTSVRTVPLFPVLREILEVHRAKQNGEKLNAGNLWQEKDLVFCTRTGGFLNANDVRDSFYRILKRVGLPRVLVHDLRHTASTIWESLGISDKVRQAWLGHASIQITRNVYTHVLPSMEKEAAERVNGLFQNPGTRG